MSVLMRTVVDVLFCSCREHKEYKNVASKERFHKLNAAENRYALEN